jgi:tRNA/tmRNA/rRNA uracil-C5-methylase (TrmA/RlmC/RlmD family)
MQENWDRRAVRDAFYYVETAHWDGDVAGFFALGEQRAQLLVDPVLAELRRLPERESALDLGCGVGRFSRAFARRFRDVLGVDVSTEMVKKARELHPRRPMQTSDSKRLTASRFRRKTARTPSSSRTRSFSTCRPRR